MPRGPAVRSLQRLAPAASRRAACPVYARPQNTTPPSYPPHLASKGESSPLFLRLRRKRGGAPLILGARNGADQARRASESAPEASCPLAFDSCPCPTPPCAGILYSGELSLAGSRKFFAHSTCKYHIPKFSSKSTSLQPIHSARS